MNKFDDPHVAEVFNDFPDDIRKQLLFLRQLVFATAAETEGVQGFEEALRWGEPSYLTKSGSTLRLGWKKSRPQQFAMYFHCQTRLVDTFRELYRDMFTFEGNRAIVFNLNDEIPVNELKHCISLSLTYHRRKHLSMLGA